MSAAIAEVRKVFAGQLWWAFLLVGVGLSVITIVAITPDHVAAVAPPGPEPSAPRSTTPRGTG